MVKRLTIAGFGLIGGSIALATRQRPPHVHIVAIDRKPIVETALRMNLADSGGESLTLAEGSDLVVLAAPVRQNIELLGAIADRVQGPLLVTDVGSTKVETVRAARALPTRIRFVGGHPLAGAASGGVAVARSGLFQGRPWILTAPPAPGAAPDASDHDFELVKTFVESLGAVSCRLTPDEHDAVMAYVSHLPQLAISALMHVVGERVRHDGLLLAGNGLRDSTRLASSPADTWRDIASTNAPGVTAAIDDFIHALERLKQDLAQGDELTRVFDSAAEWKRVLN
jgi:prephenate dehydrogenase